MAAINPTLKAVGRKDGSCVLATWVLTPGDTAVPIDLPDLADKSFHAYGTWGGGTITLLGANNGTGSNGVGLRSPDSVAISFTSDSLKQVLENAQQVWPVLTGGAASSITCALLVKQNNALRT